LVCKGGKLAVIGSLKQQVRFGQFNLIDGALDQQQFYVIFCRNVLIYFDHNTKQKVIERLRRKLKPGGYLFTGRSESIHALEPYNLQFIASRSANDERTTTSKNV
jgi:chemotaxis protein methyltransferase CheR